MLSCCISGLGIECVYSHRKRLTISDALSVPKFPQTKCRLSTNSLLTCPFISPYCFYWLQKGGGLHYLLRRGPANMTASLPTSTVKVGPGNRTRARASRSSCAKKLGAVSPRGPVALLFSKPRDVTVAGPGPDVPDVPDVPSPAAGLRGSVSLVMSLQPIPTHRQFTDLQTYATKDHPPSLHYFRFLLSPTQYLVALASIESPRLVAA